MRISDFGLLDPDDDPNRHQNLSPWSLGHALPLQEISSKSVHNFFSYPTDRQTDLSNRPNRLGGGNKVKHVKKLLSVECNKLHGAEYKITRGVCLSVCLSVCVCARVL